MKKQAIFLLSTLILVICLKPAYAITSLKVLPKKVNLGIIKSNDYERGYVEKLRGSLLLIRDSSNDWKVMVRTDDDNMGVIGDYTKPISDLHWRAIGNYATQVSYTSITTYDIEVARGPRGGQNRIFIDYKVLLSWTEDVPGEYYITLLYTLTTQ